MAILEELVDPKVISILKVLLKEPKGLFHLQKISRLSKVPLASTFRIVNSLVSKELVSVVTVDKLKLYQLPDTKKTEELKKLLK